MRGALILLAICGVTYGGYALYGLGSFSDDHRQEIYRKAREISEHAGEGGLRGLVFRMGQPLFWLVLLPAVSTTGALLLAALFVLPAFLVK